MKVQTVNVIEVVDSTVDQVLSFTDDEKGNKEAEEVFIKMATENGMNKEDIESSIENGYWDDNDEKHAYASYNIFITHSS